MNAAELARQFEMSERNVYRDLQTLNESGIPCSYDEESRGYRVAPGFFMPPIELTFEEAMALSTVLEDVPRDGQIPFFETARPALEKIRSQLPEAIREELEPLDGHVTIDSRAAKSGTGLATCTNASETRCKLSGCCAAATIRPSRSIATTAPYLNSSHIRCGFCQRGWYAVGQRSDRDEIRRLKLNRFDYVDITDKPYFIPEDFRLSDHLGLAWRMIRGEQRYKIAVRFEPGFADAASETRWHPTQEAEWDGDRVTLRFEVDGLDEILYWVMGYANGATVLEPPELIARVK